MKKLGFYIIVLVLFSGCEPRIETVSKRSPPDLTYLCTNEKGYKEYKNNKDGSILIKIPAGEFTMGSYKGYNEKPVHKVYLDEYYIGKYEVTNKQYKKFCDATGRSYLSAPEFEGMNNYFVDYPDYPVVEVIWNDAVAYCKWAGLRLPTEAEWEKAARGKDSRKYPWGNSEPDTGGTYRANYYAGDNGVSDGYRYTSPVGSFTDGISLYGCYDMAGNVWEWCSDWYEYCYRDSPERNPKGPSSGEYRVVRGGSWCHYVRGMRCATRDRLDPAFRWFLCGFRVVSSPK